jgi:alpha-D-ribose 1-methylphosphonate 5-triphosphate synthase subunit PhnG
MNDDADKTDSGTARAVATVVNSKAAEKLAGAVEGLVQFPRDALDYLVGPDRIRAVRTARADAALIEARAQSEIERLRVETAEFVLDREMRKTENRRAIVAEAHKALPPPKEAISDQPVSRDFVHAFFDEFDGISDPEVHKIAGRLLAGEVVCPGSFPRRTMRVLRDLESRDFAQFTRVCRYGWNIGGLTPVIYDLDAAIYTQQGVDFSTVQNLTTLGLLTFEPIGGFSRTQLPPKLTITYGQDRVQIELKQGGSTLNIGDVLLTEAGLKLAHLTRAQVLPGFLEYAMDKWRAEGHKMEVVSPAPGPSNEASAAA